MIFVSVGTQDKSFTRLLELIDKEIEKGFIKEEVIVQSGYTKYNSKNMKILDYVSKDEFNKLSDVVIVNRMDEKVKELDDEIYTRDLFTRD